MRIINDRIQKFKEDIIASEPRQIVQNYIDFGDAYVFGDDKDKYFQLKKVIADKFEVNPRNVVMIGSAKLGFSIAPNKLWRNIRDDSDIDMVIISQRVYDIYWKKILNFFNDYGFYDGRSERRLNSFLKYAFKGWLRPDLFPFGFEGTQAWFDFFQSISYKEYDKRKIACALFRDNDFFETYHNKNIKQIKQNLESDNEVKKWLK